VKIDPDRVFETPAGSYSIDDLGTLYALIDVDGDQSEWEPVADFTDPEAAEQFYTWLDGLLPRAS